MTVVFDAERETRTGVAEAVFCAGKTPDQIATILAEAVAAGRRLLLTRLRPEAFAALPPTARLDLDSPRPPFSGRSRRKRPPSRAP
jgi:NCAIR mutase (PurE)-related protein